LIVFASIGTDKRHVTWFLFGAVRHLTLAIAIFIAFSNPTDQIAWINRGSPVTLYPQPHLDNFEVRAANAHIDTGIQSLFSIAVTCSIVETVLCSLSLHKLFCGRVSYPSHV